MRRKFLEFKARRAQIQAALMEERTGVFSATTGLLLGYLGEIGVHEFGHVVAAKIFGNDVEFAFRADSFHTIPYADHVRSAIEEFSIVMGGPIADYAASITALIYANRAREDSTIRRPLAAAYSMIASMVPFSQSLGTFANVGDFHYLDYFGIPKEAQVAAAAAMSFPIAILGAREVAKTYRMISEQSEAV